MTNYGMPDALTSLWKEILDRHWRYLETEESLEKIAERKKLEGCLREYLSVVSHDKKFLLPETADVLRNSVLQMKDCSMYKLAIGFESISQYANNLFTKPWRKEYRTIKLYSGFYQHEIHANLLNAEKLFLAMGYKLMPNHTMVLEDPICPDQVTNVSRDAMCAMVECQIMKQVNSDLTAMQLPSSWFEIFNYRERHVGDSSNTLKGLKLQIQHRTLRKSQNENYYNAAPLVPSTSSNQIPPQSVPYMCSSQASQCVQHPYSQQQQQQQQQQQSYLPPPHQNLPNCSSSYSNSNPPAPPPPHCSVHMNGSVSVYGHGKPQQSPNPNYNHFYQQPPVPPPPITIQQQQQQSQQPPVPAHHMPMSIPHSKSLDQYDHSMNSHNHYYHRHSVDHAISLKNSQHQQPPAFDCVDSCNFSAFKNHPYNVPNNRFPLPFQISNSNLGGGYGNGMMYKNNILPNPMSAGPQQAAPDQYYDPQQMMYYQQNNPNYYHQAQQQQHMPSQPHYHPHHHHHMMPPTPHHKKPMDSPSDIIPPPMMSQQDMISFADKPPQKEEVKLKSSLRMPKNQQDYSNYRNDSGDKNSDSFDSFDDDIRMSRNKQTPVPSTTSTNNSDLINIKSQEGIGSYDAWNYVFQNLEKQKYDELGDRGEMMNPEELEIEFDNLAMSSSINNIGNHSRNGGKHDNNNNSNHKMSSRSSKHQEVLPPPLHPKKQQSHQNSSSKSANSVQTKNSVQKSSKSNGSKSYCDGDNQNLVNIIGNGDVKTNGNNNSSSNSTASNHKKQSIDRKSSSSSKQQQQQQDDSQAKEWSCRFCTFLNPETVRICGMCAKTKDLFLDSDKNGTATCF